MSVSRPDYVDIKRALRQGEAPLDAAECHGLLCGMLCAGGSVPPAQWLQEFLDERDAGNVLMKEAERTLRALYQATLDELCSETIEFQPLLPDDQAPLYERVLEMANFCRGFLYGFGARGRVAQQQLPAHTRELLADFAELARAAAGDGPAEELERAYTEVLEYIRVGVLLISDEMQPLHAGPEVH